MLKKHFLLYCLSQFLYILQVVFFVMQRKIHYSLKSQRIRISQMTALLLFLIMKPALTLKNITQPIFQESIVSK